MEQPEYNIVNQSAIQQANQDKRERFRRRVKKECVMCGNTGSVSMIKRDELKAAAYSFKCPCEAGDYFCSHLPGITDKVKRLFISAKKLLRQGGVDNVDRKDPKTDGNQEDNQ